MTRTYLDIIEQVSQNLLAEDFHDGGTQQTWTYYYNAAVDKINSMTNAELLELIFPIED